MQQESKQNNAQQTTNKQTQTEINTRTTNKPQQTSHNQQTTISNKNTPKNEQQATIRQANQDTNNQE